MGNVSTGTQAWPLKVARSISPVWAAFFGSALLSLIAIATSGTLNRDGMLYVDAARLFQQGGFSAAREVFAWPFLPVLMATTSQLTGLGLENAGHLLNILFMAGACAFLVACTTRLYPEAVWPTCLVLLAIPGLNDYRNELLREYGCWFFLMFSFWLALRWAERPRWRSALAAQAALGVAALFRPETLAFFPALIAWQLFEAPKGHRLHRFLMIGALPLLGLVALIALYSSGNLSSTGRIAQDLSRFSPARFAAKAQAIAPALHEYARDQAGNILFFGSLAIIPLKFVKKMGIFMIPLLFLFVGRPGFGAWVARSRLFAWAFAAHLLVLAVFVTDLQFVAGRYVALLMLLAAPLTGAGLTLLLDRYPRWQVLIIALSLLVALNNVVALSPGKRHFVEAGAWLAKNATDSPRVYVESPRAAYYAGWRFSGRPADKSRTQLVDALNKGECDLAVLEISRNDPDIGPWLESHGLREVRRFTHANRDAVLIAEPIPTPAQSSASKTERIRRKTGATE